MVLFYLLNTASEMIFFWILSISFVYFVFLIQRLSTFISLFNEPTAGFFVFFGMFST